MPQPIDMQSELGRTLAAERIQDAAARAAQLAQQRAQLDAERQRAERERMVARPHEPESAGVNSDGKGRQPGSGRKPGEAATPADVPQAGVGTGEEHVFDVTA